MVEQAMDHVMAVIIGAVTDIQGIIAAGIIHGK